MSRRASLPTKRGPPRSGLYSAGLYDPYAAAPSQLNANKNAALYTRSAADQFVTAAPSSNFTSAIPKKSSPSTTTTKAFSLPSPSTTASSTARKSSNSVSSDATKASSTNMSWYDQIEIEDMTYDPRLNLFHYPCPCGDRFEVCIDDLLDGSTDTAVCPSCSLTIQVIFERSDLDAYLPQNMSYSNGIAV